MPIGEVCHREVVFTKTGSTIADAARLMRERHVGALVVVDEEEGKRIPVGILTDRDIVMDVIACDQSPDVAKVGEIMCATPVTVDESCGVFETVRLMRDKAIRRIPVVNQRGSLCGIVTMDDLLGLLAEELTAISRLVSREQKVEKRTRASVS